MRQYKFDKPLVESSTSPKSTSVYWVDVAEPTKELLTIKTFDRESSKWVSIMKKPGYYSVTTVVDGEGMTLTSDKDAYNVGETVLLTATFEEGYELDEFEVTWAGGEVEVTEIDDTHWSYVMPAGDVQAAACAKAQKFENYAIIQTTVADPIVQKILCSTKVVVESIKNGEIKIEEYNSLSSSISVQADANTDIKIYGDITQLYLSGFGGSGDTHWTKADLSHCATITEFAAPTCSNLISLNTTGCGLLEDLTLVGCNLSSIDLSTNTALKSIGITGNNLLESLNLSNNIVLTNLNCGNNSGLKTIDISANTALADFSCSSTPSIIEIKYSATNEDVSTAVAGAITDADSTTGTVYTDSAGAYYSTIADAATAKGWTIEQL